MAHYVTLTFVSTVGIYFSPQYNQNPIFQLLGQMLRFRSHLCFSLFTFRLPQVAGDDQLSTVPKHTSTAL